ncbi:MAG TPA: ABC-F family ATP-binding cassette domain-containing protein [Gaiellaceae bacterium]|nr:ABC-F family ATP-binding cassette domain-containing protein [Gaiellaceae bacterium]
MRVQLAGVTRHHGAHSILDDVTLTVSPESRIGLVGPNGVGKSTLLRLLAGLEAPDAGTVVRTPASLSVGYLPQEPDARPDETVLAALARRTGVAAAQAELERTAAALASDAAAADDYEAALHRFLALGGGDLEARAAAVCVELGLGVALDRPAASLSGGEAARAALASILLSRFDVLLLDEPTNDLDFDGLDRLERFLLRREGGLVLVSHDRELLDRIVGRIVEVDPWTHGVREWPGGWSDYAAARDAARARQYARFEDAQERRRHVQRLLARRRSEARAAGGMADRRGTHALMTKVRQAERSLERVDEVAKPHEPWELRLSLRAAERGGDVLASLRGAVAVRGSFRLGPVDLELTARDRVAVTGPNGSGKSTLLAMLLGELPLAAGARHVGRRTSIGVVAQDRGAYGGEPLLEAFAARTGLAPVDARTLLAKFGLGAGHVGRAGVSLSPGERTRAHLAELQARGVNLLVLDEPTNHLDLEAVEQLEAALAEYDGALVVVSHDRRFLAAVAPSRELPVEDFVAQSH